MNQTQSKYKYAIVPGNNGNVVRTCMSLRHERWVETSYFDKLFNFKWQQLSRGI